jgi:hypothetical protein
MGYRYRLTVTWDGAGSVERGDPSVVMQALKQGFAQRLLRRMRAQGDPRQGSLWRRRWRKGTSGSGFYDFVVFSEEKED